MVYITDRGITVGGAECPPRDFPPGNFWRLIGKDEARKKRNKMEKMLKKMRKNGKGKEENEEKWEKLKIEGGNEKCKGKKY